MLMFPLHRLSAADSTLVYLIFYLLGFQSHYTILFLSKICIAAATVNLSNGVMVAIIYLYSTLKFQISLFTV